LKIGHLVNVSLFDNLIINYSLPFDVPAGHVAFEGPPVLGAELVAVHPWGPIRRRTVPQGMQSNPLFEGFLRQTGYLAAEPAVRKGKHLCLGIVRVRVVGQPLAQIFVAEREGNSPCLGLGESYIDPVGFGFILIPEIPYDMNIITEKVKERNKKGKRFSIVVIAEGAKPKGGDIVIQRIVKESSDPIRLGGIGFVVGEQIEKITGLETRTVVMGHLLRGGSPTPFDRILATGLGTKAVDMIEDKEFGYMVGVKRNSLVTVPLKEVAKGPKIVPSNHPMIKAARSLGTCFGD